MNIFGIGPLELLFIFLIALILLGPTDMVSTSRKLGSLLRKFFTSSTWKSMKKIRDLPAQIMRDSGIDDLRIDDLGLKEIKKEIDGEIKKSLPKKEELTVNLDSKHGSESTQKDGVDLTSWITKPQKETARTEQNPEAEQNGVGKFAEGNASEVTTD